MNSTTIPTIILGGSDGKPVRLPEAGRGKHPLSGYKGVDIRIGGQPLVQTIAQRLRASGCFGPIFLAGPGEVYRDAVEGLRLIDTDGSFGGNIRAALELVRKHYQGSPVAFITCDILPEVETLVELIADFKRQSPCDLWFPLVRAPQDPSRLGAAEWKPAYRIAPAPGEDPVGILPGHLAIVDPAALRVKFMYKLFDLGYRTRNRPIGDRRSVMLRRLFAELLYQDLRHLFWLRAPTLTWSVVGSALPAARKLAAGTSSVADLEHALRKMFVLRRHRKAHPERRIVLPVVDYLSLALDIDTEEEARQMGGAIVSESA